MYLLLTDHLTCPRCGPAFGLILLASHTEDRRVIEGDLGCSNCRDRLPVREGLADLRPPPRDALPLVDGLRPADADPERIEGLRVALGIGEGAGITLLLGSAVAFAPALARACPEIEMVAADARVARWPEAPGVTRMLTREALPFFSSRVRGVVLGPDVLERSVLEEAVRVLAPRHRVVAPDPPDGTRARFTEVGLGRIVEGPGMLVGER
jgi:uncharacterized protein YbaR (Trm112 family)